MSAAQPPLHSTLKSVTMDGQTKGQQTHIYSGYAQLSHMDHSYQMLDNGLPFQVQEETVF